MIAEDRRQLHTGTVHMPEIKLVGISTVHGNTSVENATMNAARLLASFGTEDQRQNIRLCQGATQPLLRRAKNDPEIHGPDGLGGVEGLLPHDHDIVHSISNKARERKAIHELAEAVRKDLCDTLIATGPLTNVALFIATHPELLPKIEQIVIMGGAEGRGNRSPTAEFNILCDPEAAQIVFDANVRVIMVPLNVTHTNLFTQAENNQLLNPRADSPFSTKASTHLRHTLSTLLTFFADTYARVFNFRSGPPVHDPLCVFYVAFPEKFTGTRFRVDCELTGTYTAGTTSVDLWGYKTNEMIDWIRDPGSRESWGRFGKNVWLAESVDVPSFWQSFHEVLLSVLDASNPLTIN
ncbi:Uridine nucleosidase 1 [Microbotryomycetes sp. JL221]|nr:Uridine nucleosidase 1 [Microbotryomycetes sp. JL221]